MGISPSSSVMKSKNSKTLLSDRERNSVLGKPPPIETLMCGKCFFTYCADRNAAYKFPGKGTEMRKSVGFMALILSCNN